MRSQYSRGSICAKVTGYIAMSRSRGTDTERGPAQPDSNTILYSGPQVYAPRQSVYANDRPRRLKNPLLTRLIPRLEQDARIL